MTKRKGTRIRVKSYTMKRRGKTFRVKGYLRKRPRRR